MNLVKPILSVLLFVFLLPYVVSCLWGQVGEESEALSFFHEEESTLLDRSYEITLSREWGSQTMPMDKYLIGKLAAVMPKNPQEGKESIVYEDEALKAQAILLRTELIPFLRSQQQQTDSPIVLKDSIFDDSLLDEMQEESRARYEQAVHITDGVYLAYQGEAIKAAYFYLSNGSTRDAAEVWDNAAYPYFKRTVCGQDILAKDYQKEVVISKEAFQTVLKDCMGISSSETDFEKLQCSYDSAGYVIQAQVEEWVCDGETMRYAFGLPSASFTIEWRKEEVVFHVKGIGHGFGMSQYGANQMAKQGESFDAILKNYFFQAELLKIE